MSASGSLAPGPVWLETTLPAGPGGSLLGPHGRGRPARCCRGRQACVGETAQGTQSVGVFTHVGPPEGTATAPAANAGCAWFRAVMTGTGTSWEGLTAGHRADVPAARAGGELSPRAGGLGAGRPLQETSRRGASGHSPQWSGKGDGGQAAPGMRGPVTCWGAACTMQRP